MPALPDNFVLRSNDHNGVLDVLLERGDRQQWRVAAHGMGGLGKTMLAVSVCRSLEVRSCFSRLGFVSVGHEPSMLVLQQTLHAQLVGSSMEGKAGASPESQRGVLQTAATGQKWLVVLDDLWDADHERLLNFFDEDDVKDSRAKILVTTRFAKLVPGYVSMLCRVCTEVVVSCFPFDTLLLGCRFPVGVVGSWV